MRILQINNHEAIGGGSERVYQLTTQMLLDGGHAVATLACGSTPFDARKTSVLLPLNGYIERNPLRTLRNIGEFVYRPATARALRQLVADFKPDLAHLHITYGQLSNAVIGTLHQLGVPMVMTVHEYRMLCPVSTLFTPKLGVCERCAGGRLGPALRERCNRGSLAASALSVLEARVRDARFDYPSHIDHFFMVSRFCRDKHVQHRPALAAKSSVLYNFVDLPPAPRRAAQPHQYLYAGRLSPEKGLPLLCEVFAQRPHETLRIAGDGPLGEGLRQRFAGCANLHFLGRLDRVALEAEMQRAWFSLAPSEWYENNPMSVLESFAQGTPVLATDIGGLPELVQTGRTGLLFAPSSAASLAEALDAASALDAATRVQWGAHARQLVATQHARQAHHDALMQGYRQVLARRSEAA